MGKNIKMKTVFKTGFKSPGAPLPRDRKIYYGESTETANEFDIVLVKEQVGVEIEGKKYTGYVLLCLDEVV